MTARDDLQRHLRELGWIDSELDRLLDAAGREAYLAGCYDGHRGLDPRLSPYMVPWTPPRDDEDCPHGFSARKFCLTCEPRRLPGDPEESE